MIFKDNFNGLDVSALWKDTLLSTEEHSEGASECFWTSLTMK